jgi:uncharacterized membrane protein HdeD (DUF308 family)
MSNGGNTEAFGEVRRNWSLLLMFGILLIILGCVGLGMAFFITMASVMFYGILLLIGGAAQLARSFVAVSWRTKLWHILISLLYLFGGIVVIRNPALVSGFLTLLLASAITGIGLFRIIMAIQIRERKGWIWVLLSGIVALALGIWMFSNLAALSLIIIGLFISIELIVNGWSVVSMALAARAAR